MIVETLDEELVEVPFLDPPLPGTRFLSVTFGVEDRQEFAKSGWAKATQFEEACKKYISLVK